MVAVALPVVTLSAHPVREAATLNFFVFLLFGVYYISSASYEYLFSFFGGILCRRCFVRLPLSGFSEYLTQALPRTSTSFFGGGILRRRCLVYTSTSFCCFGVSYVHRRCLVHTSTSFWLPSGAKESANLFICEACREIMSSFFWFSCENIKRLSEPEHTLNGHLSLRNIKWLAEPKTPNGCLNLEKIEQLRI